MNTALVPRIERFLEKPWREKGRILTAKTRSLWDQFQVNLPIVTRMKPGFLFVVWNDAVREATLSGDFEKAERKFVETSLRPGMVFLDVGAYYGIYSLTASAKVGSRGRVIAFEPSPFQRRRLRWHLWLNRCTNVTVESLALGSLDGESQFFVAGGGAEGFSGLRSPDVGASVRSIRVRVVTSDDYLRQHSIPTVDFVKVDIEGGELDFFKGAECLLKQNPRPLILCELWDVRAEAWGHRAKDTAAYVKNFGFQWFKPLHDGRLVRLPADPDRYDGNFVAVPTERMNEINEAEADESDA